VVVYDWRPLSNGAGYYEHHHALCGMAYSCGTIIMMGDKEEDRHPLTNTTTTTIQRLLLLLKLLPLSIYQSIYHFFYHHNALPSFIVEEDKKEGRWWPVCCIRVGNSCRSRTIITAATILQLLLFFTLVTIWHIPLSFLCAYCWS